MRVGDLALARTREGDGLEVSARVGNHRIWFRVPSDHPTPLRADPFLVVGLLGAMAAGEPLEADPDLPVSPRLLAGIDAAQDILHAWNPVMRKVAVTGGRPEPDGPRATGEAVFFSGGVDGTFSLLKHAGTVTHLIFIHGLEITVGNEERFARALDRNRETAAAFGKVLLPVRTNAREIASAHRISNRLFHGPMLGAVAEVLGFPVTYIGATYTYAQLFPWGSHPLLDPLWSTEGTAVVHDGAEASRSEKLARIVGSPVALKHLRVCLSEAAEYNCGRCSKCLRTMVTLRLLRAHCPDLPPLRSLGEVRRGLGTGSHERVWLEDNLALARRVGDREVVRALAAALRKARLLELLRALDAGLGGRLRNVFDRWGGRAPGPEIHPEAR